MIVTIRIPDDTVQLLYADAETYEDDLRAKVVTFDNIIELKKED